MATSTDRPALRALAGIVDLPVRVGAVAKWARARPDAYVAELESLLTASAAGLGTDRDRDVLLACALWLLNDGQGRVVELHAIATQGGHPLVSAMLADDDAHRALAARGRLPELGVAEGARVLCHLVSRGDDEFAAYEACGVTFEPPSPLGRKRTPGPVLETAGDFLAYFAELVARLEAEPAFRRAMHPSFVRKQIERLASHHSAFTIGRLLDEPAVRQRDVVTIAARRPTTPAIVREITSRLRWMQDPNVRAALVANPFTPTRVSLILTATFLPRLAAIASGNVHPRVRELAVLLRASPRPILGARAVTGESTASGCRRRSPRSRTVSRGRDR